MSVVCHVITVQFLGLYTLEQQNENIRHHLMGTSPTEVHLKCQGIMPRIFMQENAVQIIMAS